MHINAVSIRPFIGAKDFEESIRFYTDMGFQQNILMPNLSVFHNGKISFYLQDYYAKEWVDNTMVFVEVGNVNEFWEELISLDLPTKYSTIKLVPVRKLDWGSECFVHDPSGILWHFGEFNQKTATES